jgi:hypothetical protein
MYTTPIVARQRLSKHVPVARNARNNGIIVVCVCVSVGMSAYSPVATNNSEKSSRCNEGLLAVSFSMRFVSYQWKVGD